MRTFAGQPQHGRTADIAPRSGNQCDLPFELAHAPITPAILWSDPRLRLCSAIFQNRALAATLDAHWCQGWDRVPLVANDDAIGQHALRYLPQPLAAQTIGRLLVLPC